MTHVPRLVSVWSDRLSWCPFGARIRSGRYRSWL